jgi:hypothetical protein
LPSAPLPLPPQPTASAHKQATGHIVRTIAVIFLPTFRIGVGFAMARRKVAHLDGHDQPGAGPTARHMWSDNESGGPFRAQSGFWADEIGTLLPMRVPVQQ